MGAYWVDIAAVTFFVVEWLAYGFTLEHTSYGRDSLSARMVTYGALVTLYLAYLGFAGGLTGILLWPAVILHAILTALLTLDVARMPRTR